MTLQEKIDKKKIDIQKRKNITLKLEKKLEQITDTWEIEWAKDEISTSFNKERDLQTQLENLYKQQEKQTATDNIERIPVIEEFLENWKRKAIEYYIEDYEKLDEYLTTRYEKRKLFQQWKTENKYSWQNTTETEAKEKELEIDRETHNKIMKYRFSPFTIELESYGNNWKEKLETLIEKDKQQKREILIKRVKEITGKITDASYLTIGDNAEINGIVIGEKGKAKVETISAGGYNIQCFHYRVLVKEI